MGLGRPGLIRNGAKIPGHSCSKLTMSLVKTLVIKYGIYTNIFAKQMRVAFEIAKAAQMFTAKIHLN